MIYIVLKDLAGNERLVPDGAPYRLNPGEFVVGSRGNNNGERQLEQETLVELAKHADSNLGSVIEIFAKPVAIVLGMDKCTSCNLRKIILNLKNKLGWKAMLDLVRRSFKEPPEIIAAEIKKVLES